MEVAKWLFPFTKNTTVTYIICRTPSDTHSHWNFDFYYLLNKKKYSYFYFIDMCVNFCMYVYRVFVPCTPGGQKRH